MELVATTIPAAYSEDIYDDFGVVGGDTQYYRKEHADKYIRKYMLKHCLDMAKWCGGEHWRIRNIALRDMSEHELWLHDTEYWDKWRDRWQKIAERLK